MKTMTTRRYLLLCLLSMSISLAAQDQHFTQLDVFELEWAADPQLSPDGAQVVYSRTYMDIMTDRRDQRLWIVDADGTHHRKLTSHDKRESSATWSPSGDRIAYVSSGEHGAEIHIYWTTSGTVASITHLEHSPRSLTWSPDGRWIAFGMFVPTQELSLAKPPQKPEGAKWAAPVRVTTRMKHEADGSGYMDPGFMHYFVVPADGGTARQITTGDYQHRSAPTWSPDGKHLYFSAHRSDNWQHEFRESNIYKVDVASGAIQQLTDRIGPDNNPMPSPDGSMIAYLGYDDKVQTYQLPHLYIMAPDGSGKKKIELDIDRNISDLTWSADGRRIYFMYDSEGDTKIASTDLNGNWNKIIDKVGGTSVARPYSGGSYHMNTNGDITYTLSSPYHPADVGLYSNGTLDRLTHLNDDLLTHRKLGEVEEIWYESSYDNRNIQGWTIKPPHYEEGRKYPVIVENHGGPIANYGDRFSPELQLMATEGYVVFYPNPRGSTSYGEEFGNLLYHNYPGQDYDDVMSGVDALIDQGLVHPDSLFVTGGSAGGIMTAWIIGKNNRFRAAAVVKPVMNWYTKTLEADNWYGYYHSRFPGLPWENQDVYMKFSPISLVGNIQTPTLVMVGTNDLRTPISQAKQLYHALKYRKIETAYIEVPGSYHFIGNRPSQMIAKVDNILGWFNQYR